MSDLRGARTRVRWRVARALRSAGISREGLAFSPRQRTELRELLAELETSLVGALTSGGDDAPRTLVADGRYVEDAPSAQTAVDLFAGQWSSAFPPPYDAIRAGPAPLFDDARIRWMLDHFGDVRGERLLELGPLEGGHTYMLDRAGAREIVAVEANASAFLRCLVAKEILGMAAARFECGDLVGFLAEHVAQDRPRFHLGLLSGVLYHMRDPVHVLRLATQCCERVMLWTHYFDRDVLAARPGFETQFPSSVSARSDGFEHTLYRQDYAVIRPTSFCGGNAEHSNWLTRDAILGALDRFGFAVEAIAFDEPRHPNGPAFAVAARRRPSV